MHHIHFCVPSLVMFFSFHFFYLNRASFLCHNPTFCVSQSKSGSLTLVETFILFTDALSTSFIFFHPVFFKRGTNFFFIPLPLFTCSFFDDLPVDSESFQIDSVVEKKSSWTVWNKVKDSICNHSGHNVRATVSFESSIKSCCSPLHFYYSVNTVSIVMCDS